MTAATTARRRVAPTAHLVLPADADRDTWLARRTDGVGSSDVAAILGLVAQRGPLHVWHDKRGTLPDDDAGEPALWGTLLEDVVAREWARRNRSVISRVGLVANSEAPWMLATLDRRVHECPLDRSVRAACALEVKCRNAFTANRWRADVPDDVLAQAVWQMAATGYRHIHVAVLIGGSDYRQTVVRWDADLAAYILGEVGTWRERYLLPGVPPPWDPERAEAHNALDAALHPERVGEIGVEEIGAVMEYATASAAAGAADKRLKVARAELARLADGRRYVTFANELAYEFAPVARTSVDVAALRERYPDVAAEVVTDTQHHQIRIARQYRARAKEQTSE